MDTERCKEGLLLKAGHSKCSFAAQSVGEVLFLLCVTFLLELK
jgi:hypothetical protein